MSFSQRNNSEEKIAGIIVDIKDYSQKLTQVNDRHRKEQGDLRSSYDKRIDDMKETFGNKYTKQAKNYDAQNAKLSEQNEVNNQLFSDKTKQAIQERQETFREGIKKNSERFDADRNIIKTNFDDKLSNLSESYKKSSDENDRFHNQAEKTMGERYSKASEKSRNDFDKQINMLDSKSKISLADEKNHTHLEKVAQDKENITNIEELRSAGEEQKFREVGRLKNENESLRTSFGQERNSMQERQDARVADILKLKNTESEEGQKNFANLQDNIVKKNLAAEELVKSNHQAESKALTQKFDDDVRNIQHFADKKIRNSSEVSSLKDSNKHLAMSSENRIHALQNNIKEIRDTNTAKENEVNSTYRDKLKSLKESNVEEFDRHEAQTNNKQKEQLEAVKEKNNSLINRYKTEVGTTKSDGEEKLGKANQLSKDELQKQRVEFGKYINTVNNNKLEEISLVKNESNKDKTTIVEKLKHDLSNEKMSMREEFLHQNNFKDDMYEKKMAEMEKQTNKIIDNYENKVMQIARKAENEVENLKSTNELHRLKEGQAIKDQFDSQEAKHQAELGNMRDKYENMIGKDRYLNEQQANHIVQKYEDMLEHERAAEQKEISVRVGESEAKFQRLFKSSELEKESIRNQYEQRIENMRLANLKVDGNSKKV